MENKVEKAVLAPLSEGETNPGPELEADLRSPRALEYMIRVVMEDPRRAAILLLDEVDSLVYRSFTDAQGDDSTQIGVRWAAGHIDRLNSILGEIYENSEDSEDE